MSTVSLSTLRTRVRETADMEKSKFVSDATLNRFINASAARFHDMVTKAYEDYFLADPVSFTLASGEYQQTLATDFYKLVGVDYFLGGSWVEVNKFNFHKRNITSANIVNRVYHPSIRYRLMGSKLVFAPMDDAAGTYRYWYNPLYTPMTSDTDTIDGYNGWDEWVVVDSAIKCLRKEESDTSELVLERKELETAIFESAQNRDAGEPEQIADVGLSGMRYGGYWEP